MTAIITNTAYGLHPVRPMYISGPLAVHGVVRYSDEVGPHPGLREDPDLMTVTHVPSGRRICTGWIPELAPLVAFVDALVEGDRALWETADPSELTRARMKVAMIQAATPDLLRQIRPDFLEERSA